MTKYKDACVALRLGLTKYTIKNEGNNKHSYKKKKKIMFETATYKNTIIKNILK